jgi:hypothetical protein
MFRSRYTVKLLKVVEDDDRLLFISASLAERFNRNPRNLKRMLERPGDISTPMSLEDAEILVSVCQRLGLEVGITAAS